MPEASKWDRTLVAALRRQVERHAEAPFASFHDECRLSFGELDRESNAFAGGLADLGVGPGDRVMILAHNSAEFLVTMLGAHKRRAILVPVNVELHGTLLEHQVRNSEPKVIVVDANLAGRLDDLPPDAAADAQRVTIGSIAASSDMRFEELRRRTVRREAVLEPAPQETAIIMYTSGTTGPAKGVLMPHAHCFLFGLLVARAQEITSTDCFYVSMPMFHVNALLMSIGCCLIVGARVHVARRFSASAWIDEIRACGATVTNALGVMPEFIMRQPPSVRDRDHSLRRMMAVPIAEEWGAAFQTRFGIRLIQVYGMTECNIVAYSMPGDAFEPGCAGPILTGIFDIRIADPETDEALPVGSVGEILVRPCEPSCFMQGYHRMPEETVQTWRNLWFHTGDAGRIDERGRLHFVDRLRDCIRRRGENISSFDIEQVLNAHPAVVESAVMGVKVSGAGGEEEVKACVVRADVLDPVALLDWCVERLPRFAVPRFVEFIDALDKTPTGKIKKQALREQGVTAETWDREAVGYRLTR